MMLNILTDLPDNLLELEPNQLHTILPGPTLIHLRGQRKCPLFVSSLLHGNEDTSWLALRKLLLQYQNRELPRALSIFIGNVQAARHGLRRLEGQPDYNRIWKGGNTPEHAMTNQVLEEMKKRNVFAAIDIHNNTGMNPHYGCVNVLEPAFLHLACMFNRTIVWFTRPDEVLSMAFAKLCPAVTVECGKPGQKHGVHHALEYLDACLHLAQHPSRPVAAQDLDLFHTVAIIKVPKEVSFGFDNFDNTECDLLLRDDLDQLNFREIPTGTSLGKVNPNHNVYLETWNDKGRDCVEHWFRVEEGELRTTRSVIPSMFTRDELIIRQDCLGYLMERIDYP